MTIGLPHVCPLSVDFITKAVVGSVPLCCTKGRIRVPSDIWVNPKFVRSSIVISSYAVVVDQTVPPSVDRASISFPSVETCCEPVRKATTKSPLLRSSAPGNASYVDWVYISPALGLLVLV